MFLNGPNRVITTNLVQKSVATNSMSLDGFSTADKWEQFEFALRSTDTDCVSQPTATLLVSKSPLEFEIRELNQGCEWAIEMKAKF